MFDERCQSNYLRYWRYMGRQPAPSLPTLITRCVASIISAGMPHNVPRFLQNHQFQRSML